MIALDTHAWVWWVSTPHLLSPQARTLIDRAIVEKKIYISSISVWEVALLVLKGRLTLSLDVGDWIRTCETLPFIQFVPVSNTIALKAVRLPGAAPPDPVDRIIIATSIVLDLVLVTKDKKIRGYAPVKTVW
jgi:PIN domain nuclease of toxin-antitoxin system